MMTAPKVNVFAPTPQDTTHWKEEAMLVARESVAKDSLTTDSLSTVLLAHAETPKKPKYKYRYGQDAAYNQEQVYYNKYFGELFIDRRPDPVPTEEAAADTTKRKKKKFNLFPKRKKNKEEEVTEPGDESQP